MNLPRVADLLASGLKPAQVATIVGVTPARISQLLSEDSFKLLLSEKTAIIEAKDVEEITLSAKYTAAEHALVNQVMEMAPASELRDVTAALRVVAERQDRMRTRLLPVQNPNVARETIVVLALPSQAIALPVMDITNKGEVISIGERALAPLSSTAVTNLFSKMKGTLGGIVQKGEYNDPSPNSSASETSSSKDISSKENFLNYAAG